MVRFNLFSSALFAVTALAQTIAYTDSNSGISFQSWSDPTTGCQFGMALPMTPEKDFIGQIVRSSSWIA